MQLWRNGLNVSEEIGPASPIDFRDLGLYVLVDVSPSTQGLHLYSMIRTALEINCGERVVHGVSPVLLCNVWR